MEKEKWYLRESTEGVHVDLILILNVIFPVIEDI